MTDSVTVRRLGPNDVAACVSALAADARRPALRDDNLLQGARAVVSTSVGLGTTVGENQR
jgi:hypothetical protein